MKNKRGFQIPFAWLFAIIVGTFILFLAIYAATRIIGVGQYEIDTTTAKRIGILLSPLETSFESGTRTNIIMPAESRIYNDCNLEGNFGKQKISLSQKNFGKWKEPGGEVSFYNKHIFSENIIEGKKFYLFSKPFEYPFKVANIIMMSSKTYCFINPPEEIKDEILQINPENFKINNCTSGDIRVCFSGGSNCNVDVYYSQGYVEKNGNKLYFTGSLIYGAIFSEKELYECQVKRLMKKLDILASVYYEKSKFVATRECISGLEPDLLMLSSLAKNFQNSANIVSMNQIVEDIEQKNEQLICQLW